MNRMTQKEEKIRELIRSIVQEELEKWHHGEWEEEDYSFLDELQDEETQNANAEPFYEEDDWNEPESSWAFFSSSEPLSNNKGRVSQGRTRALPGWVEPNRSKSKISTPYFPRKRKK